MIDSSEFANQLNTGNCSGVFGVPDSLLAHVNSAFEDLCSIPVVTACNEGSAVSMAIGSYLATGKPGLVYMQNSGFGNALNPLLSLADEAVFGIPMVLLIGWRGAPGVADEPQHLKQGLVTETLLEAIGIPSTVLPKQTILANIALQEAFSMSLDLQQPVAILVNKGTFAPNEAKVEKQIQNNALMTREDALRLVAKRFHSKDFIVSTTGMLSREFYEFNHLNSSPLERVFLCIGGMGHASSVALGISISRPMNQVWCLDGDGSFLMHMGSAPVIGTIAPKNLKHIVFDNESHESVGGQRTMLGGTDIAEIARVSEYSFYSKVSSKEEIENALNFLETVEGPSLLHIKVGKGHRIELGRPSESPKFMKNMFQKSLD